MAKENTKRYCKEARECLGGIKGFMVGFDMNFSEAKEKRDFTAVRYIVDSFENLKTKILERVFWIPAEKQIEKLIAMLDSERDRKHFLPRFGMSFEKRKIIYQENLNLSRKPITFLPDNLLKDDTTIRVIDFDDCGYGWHMFDIVSNMFAYAYETNFEAIKSAFVEGYRSQRELSEDQLKHYDLFMLLRLMTTCGWMHTRQETETAQQTSPILAAVLMESVDEYLIENQ